MKQAHRSKIGYEVRAKTRNWQFFCELSSFRCSMSPLMKAFLQSRVAFFLNMITLLSFSLLLLLLLSFLLLWMSLLFSSSIFSNSGSEDIGDSIRTTGTASVIIAALLGSLLLRLSQLLLLRRCEVGDEAELR